MRPIAAEARSRGSPPSRWLGSRSRTTLSGSPAGNAAVRPPAQRRRTPRQVRSVRRDLRVVAMAHGADVLLHQERFKSSYASRAPPGTRRFRHVRFRALDRRQFSSESRLWWLRQQPLSGRSRVQKLDELQWQQRAHSSRDGLSLSACEPEGSRDAGRRSERSLRKPAYIALPVN